MAENDGLVVPDAQRDPRFDCNPLVTGEPHIRFYAGRRLTTPDGLPLGALAVLDTQPREEGLSELQALTLDTLAGQVMSQLELRRALQQRDQSEDAARRALAAGSRPRRARRRAGGCGTGGDRARARVLESDRYR